MKITRKLAVVDTTNRMTVAFDVSKASLSYYSEIQGKLSGNNCKEIQAVEGEIPNTIASISQALENLELFAQQQGFSGLHVVCEPTGVYHETLLRLARKSGCTTAWVSGEVVYKAKVIENNDGSKSDRKDPRVIFMLSTMGKEQVQRQIPGIYQALRELNRAYDAEDMRRSSLKTEIQTVFCRLFTDFPMCKDFIFTESGQALIDSYRANPYRIAAHTQRRFRSRMRRACSIILLKTIDKIHSAAIQSSRMLLPTEHVAALEQRLTYLYQDYRQADTRREDLRGRIASLYQQLWAAGERVPQADPKVLTAFLLGRVLGETGPITDFACWAMLLRYAGLNLRVRESGTYKGKLKLSKKGRVTLRLLLGKHIFRLIKHSEIFGEYYHRRKEQDKLSGRKLIAILQRKLLRIIYSCAQERSSFNADRLTKCESQYRLAA